MANAEVILKDAFQRTWKVETDAAGKYVFDLMDGTFQDMTLTIKSALYKDIAYSYKIDSTDRSDPLTDVLINTCLCVEKEPVIKPEEEKLVIRAEDVTTVYFDFDKSVLNEASMRRLDSIYNVMFVYSTATVQISGYTDGRGSEEYNKKLSDKRARACADYLIQRGIDASRISFVSFGACCPIEMELINGRDNSNGRSRNRRALINLKKE